MLVRTGIIAFDARSVLGLIRGALTLPGGANCSNGSGCASVLSRDVEDHADAPGLG
jgi:hypothetical protein